MLDEDQANVLRKAGQEYADGVSLRQILKRLEAEYAKILERASLNAQQASRNSKYPEMFLLYMLGATVLVYKQAYTSAEPTWDIRVALPTVQEVIYQAGESAFGNSLSRCRRGPASLLRFSL